VVILVSVADPVTPISVLQKQLRLEARAGIEPARSAATYGEGALTYENGHRETPLTQADVL